MKNSSCSSSSSSISTCSGSRFALRAGGRERLTSLLPLCRVSGLCEPVPRGLPAPGGAAQALRRQMPVSRACLEAGALGLWGPGDVPAFPVSLWAQGWSCSEMTQE